jgi:hypothetical protein
VQVAAAPLAVKKMEQKRVVNPLFEKRAKNFGIGQVGPHFSWCLSLSSLKQCFGSQLVPDSNGLANSDPDWKSGTRQAQNYPPKIFSSV